MLYHERTRMLNEHDKNKTIYQQSGNQNGTLQQMEQTHKNLCGNQLDNNDNNCNNKLWSIFTMGNQHKSKHRCTRSYYGTFDDWRHHLGGGEL